MSLKNVPVVTKHRVEDPDVERSLQSIKSFADALGKLKVLDGDFVEYALPGDGIVVDFPHRLDRPWTWFSLWQNRFAEIIAPDPQTDRSRVISLASSAPVTGSLYIV